ncbi:response regulator [Nocardioides bruguierae]|uniref:Response regulator n=1 Tax=Nocardioides bruguierae TaxID=2945102 RepID=A0A9X2DDQ2_9ACTN|nr:response regulator [Nocardioides bruguierae]MCL8027707.1 response regulator [Nocardioides bruguierae]MCM0622574.1 response regulator [Nocardioides bruguierae]
MHALIIDDSRTMRAIIARIVTELGFETTEAENGQEALDVLEGGLVPDICLIDWNMPLMDGYTFVTRVRNEPRWRNVTLMMVTTESEHSQIVRALAAGAHEYLIKPFTPDSIVEKLELLGLAAQEIPA